VVDLTVLCRMPITRVYLDPPANAVVVSVDEKSQIQALDRTAPMLPLRPGLPARQSYDYKRNATTLFAALEVATGKITADACPYANICEQCDNYVTAPEFIPQLDAQLADTTALRDDAAERGWHTEVARHSRVIASIQGHLKRLAPDTETRHKP
jgi:hypothetical protein